MARPQRPGYRAGVGRDPSFEELVLSGRSLVPSVLLRLEAEGLARGDREELLAYGEQGLVEAATRFNPELGDFRRFAYFRVRGAMLDGLRKMGPWSRRAYERIAMLGAMNEASESASETEPLEAETAEQAADRLRRHMANMVTAVTLGVFAERAHEGEDIVPKDTSQPADESAAALELQVYIEEAMGVLGEPDATIIRRMYVRGESLDEIAADMDRSRSWASRIHTRALQVLGEKLREKLR